MSRFRNVALLLLVLVLATGLASAQPSLRVKQVTSTGVDTSTVTLAEGTGARAPVAGKYWDGLSSTDFYNRPPFVAAPPNPQIAVGPDDVLTIVNRTIARYPNPNAAGNALVTNPYFNPPTDQAWLDVWLGITNLAALCPSGTGSNAVCVIDNPSIRYDQMQGRFVVLFTVTDMPAHRSNFVLIVSKFAQFTKCSTTTAGCPSSSPLFTPPVIAPVVGGGSTGGINSANWYMYTVPINLQAVPAAAPALTVSTTFCPGGGVASITPRVCTDYFPTAARMGLDNDNIILTAPVLDGTQPSGGAFEGTLPTVAGQIMGPYAGTRVVTVPKLVVYNGTSLPTAQPPGCAPGACGAVNLSDDTATGTVTACTAATVAAGACGGLNPVPGPALPPIFFEPDNLRGRALASFNSQVAPAGNPAAGVITPIDYLVGTRITDQLMNPFAANTSGVDLAFFVQPIVFTCPASSVFSDPVVVCGLKSGGANGQVPDLPTLGLLQFGASSIAVVGDPAPVGQSNAVDGTSMVTKRLFVGDSRPQQVMFREGLLYVARAVRLYDSSGNALGTSTVMYDVLRQQNPITTTTLSASVTATATKVTVTSAAGISANNTIIQIDSENMYVSDVSGTTLTVVRAFNNTTAAAHSAGTTVFVFNVSTFSTNGSTLPNPALVLETEWFNGTNVPDSTGNVLGYGFYGPMFDSPANVISVSNSTLPGSSPGSPINLFPWLEKLFVGMTTGGTTNVNNTFFNNHPSLWDFRPGDDAYDTILPYLDPVSGMVFTTVTPCTAGTTDACPMIPFGTRGGASTDPNDGSLWLYGEFAKNRLSTIPGPGQWGTSVANYALDFPATDPYNNSNQYYSDVQPGTPFFTWIQIARNVGITPLSTTTGPCPATPPGNPPVLQPPPPGGSPNPGPSTLICPLFGPTTVVTRSEMARWVILSQMDELQLNAFLAATGGNPQADQRFSSFADAIGDTNIRYIEAMYRRGYTKGCGSTNDAKRLYCPNDPITRGQMAVFLIRAKMENVFPTTLSGIPLSSPYGDNFGTFTPSDYFTDLGTVPDFVLYINKMRELRITNGTGATTYSPNADLTRQEIATFMVRAFFL